MTPITWSTTELVLQSKNRQIWEVVTAETRRIWRRTGKEEAAMLAREEWLSSAVARRWGQPAADSTHSANPSLSQKSLQT
jgi:hypothetical protein